LELEFEQKDGTSLVKLVLSSRKSGLRTERLSVPVILGEYRVRSTWNSPKFNQNFVSLLTVQISIFRLIILD
jgi:hypothetical protein